MGRSIFDKKRVGIKPKLALLAMMVLLLYFPVSGEVSSGYKLIYDVPFCDNYGPSFSTWSGDSTPPLGNVLLKGQIAMDSDTVKAGEPFDLILSLFFSSSIIGGENGAIMNDLGHEDWYLNTEKIAGEDIYLGEISGSEYLGIGAGTEIPPIVARNVTKSYEVELPDTVKPGTYSIYAYIDGTKYKTNPIDITVI